MLHPVKEFMLSPVKLGLAGGIVFGVSLFIVTILAIYTGYAVPALQILASVYPGYTITGVGAIVGLIYGFLDMFIALFLIAWIYNKLILCCNRDRCCGREHPDDEDYKR